MTRPVYLDYHATTPVDPRVLDAMLPFFTERFGNASSRTHAYGQAAAEAVDRARAEVAALIGARHHEIVFTSGATESNNLAIKGVAQASHTRGRHLLTVATEHPSVLDSCQALEREGWRVTRLPVGPDGLVDLERVEAALAADTVLVSVMTANNEIGVLQPVRDIARLAHARGALVHTDASQAVGRVPFDVTALGADLCSFTAHKIYGPKGVGALYVRRAGASFELAAQIHGGGHERGLRSGTLNVPGIAGLGRACAICRDEGAAEAARLGALRDRLLAGLRAAIPDLRVNGSMTARLPHNLNVSVPGVDGQTLALALEGLAVSSGSACHASKTDPSPVLKALGVADQLALASIRFGLGRWTTEEEIAFAVETVSCAVADLRGMRA
jgi:cysteine desulfurase